MDTLTSTFTFTLGEIRKYYAGSVAPVTPGSGIWDASVSTLEAHNLFMPGWTGTGTGNYWQRIFSRLPSSRQNVVNWQSSFGDASGTDDSSQSVLDWSSAHQQAYLAHLYGRKIYAENPGSNAYDTSGGS